MHFAGELTGSELAKPSGPAVQRDRAGGRMRSSRSTSSRSSAAAMIGPASYRYRSPMRAGRVTIFLEHNQYVGVAPVPRRATSLHDEWKQKAPRTATRERVRGAFAHLVLGERVLDQLGPAINAGHSLFVYGPPGNGKTVISQAIRNLLDGDIAIPHALEVEGQIVRLFDPVNHEPIPATPRDGR